MSVDTRRLGLVESKQLLKLAAGGEPLAMDMEVNSGAYHEGDQIGGKYRLVRLIGRGGMGVVWEAHSDALDIRVAIKLIRQVSTSSEEQHRLLLEAKATARLVDPAIVRIFDCGKTLNGEPYVVMELLEGQDLATRLDECGRLQPIEAAHTLLPIARALGTAHCASIVHRDVKPENVFLARTMTGEEQPKLLDFGIAKLDIPLEKRLTHAGSTLGSPNYMSPEQARGEEVDWRSDIWALCVVLYETIAGELPFDGDNYNAIMQAILGAPIASFTELGINEPELWTIVARGLVRDKTQRWQTCRELEEALGSWLIARGVMHDVTGVSLQRSQTNRRLSQVRTLDTVRPLAPNEARPGSPQAALAQTASRLSVRRQRFWAARPKWFTPVMAGLTLTAMALLGWRWHSPAHAEVISSAIAPLALTKPSHSDLMPNQGSPTVQPNAAPEVAASVPPSIPTASNTAARQGVASSQAKSRKPTAVPTGKAQPSSQSQPFKSPFD